MTKVEVSNLDRAVFSQLGYSRCLPHSNEELHGTLQDVANHGADSGFSGFTYYVDTVAFFKAHRKAIIALVEDMAEQMGESPVDMVSGFNCLVNRDEKDEHKRNAEKRENMPSVSRCLYGGRLTDADDLTANALAWFALEEVARKHTDF